MDTTAARIIRDKIIELEREYLDLEFKLVDVNLSKEETIKDQIKNLHKRSVLTEVLGKIVFNEEK